MGEIGTFVAWYSHSPALVEAHFQAINSGGKMPKNIATLEQAHLKYLKDLKAQGKLICGGPGVDFLWGLSIFRGNSLEEVMEYINGDPFIKTGLTSVKEVKPWFYVIKAG